MNCLKNIWCSNTSVGHGSKEPSSLLKNVSINYENSLDFCCCCSSKGRRLSKKSSRSRFDDELLSSRCFSWSFDFDQRSWNVETWRKWSWNILISWDVSFFTFFVLFLVTSFGIIKSFEFAFVWICVARKWKKMSFNL